MKLYKQIIFILIIFFKTETLLSENNLFNVNNIKIERNAKISNKALADQAIKKGFTQLIAKILLIELMSKCSYPLAKPTPMTPPTNVCVVDIGKPR